jgi:outer membrane protein TolC
MKTKCLLSLLALGLQAALAGPDQVGAIHLTPSVMNQFAEELRTNAPSLHAAEARTDGARANVAAVRTWADPEVSLGKMFAEDAMRRNEGDLLYGVSQKLPLFGQPQAARSAAEAAGRAAEARSRYQFQLLRLELVQQLLKKAVLDHHATLAAEDLEWQASLTRIVEARFKAGQGRAADILRSQNERDLLAANATNQVDLARQAGRELSRLLGRDPQIRWPTLHLPDLGPEVPFNLHIRQLTLRNEARLKVLRSEAANSEARVDVVRRAARPDVKVFGELRQYSGSGELRQGMVGIGLSIPWFNRGHYKAELSRARAESEAARYDVEDYERIVPVEAERVATLANNARRQALALRDQVIPRTEEMIEVLRRNWTAGEADLLPLLTARREWIDTRRMEAEAVSEQWRMLAELTLCCGLADLEALDMLNSLKPDAGFLIPVSGSETPSRQIP